jgi:hypothetical protein
MSGSKVISVAILRVVLNVTLISGLTEDFDTGVICLCEDSVLVQIHGLGKALVAPLPGKNKPRRRSKRVGRSNLCQKQVNALHLGKRKPEKLFLKGL